MTAFWASLPLLVALGCLALRVPAPRAAVISVAAAALVAWARFPVPTATALTTARGVIPTLAEVLAILFGGVLLAGVLGVTGAQSRIAAWLERAAAGEGQAAVLLMVMGVVPFAESVTGFGLGAAIAVPILLHLGFSPVRSMALGLMGLFLTAWGALSPGSLVAASLGGVTVHELGIASAAVAPLPIVATGLAALVLVHGRRLCPGQLAELALATAVLWGSLYAGNLLLGPQLAGAVAGLCTIAGCLVRFRLVDGVDLRVDRATIRALGPYAVLVLGLLASTLVLRAIGASGPVTLLTHGSVWSLTACAYAIATLGMTRAAAREAIATAARKWAPVAMSTGGFLVLGSILTTTGMTDELARTLAGMGPAYLFVSSLVAGLGGYVAGSTAGANAMFAASQAQAAVQLGAAKAHLLAIQNVGSGVLTMVSPTRVALAATMIDDDRETVARAATRPLMALCVVSMIGLGVIGVLFA